MVNSRCLTFGCFETCKRDENMQSESFGRFISTKSSDRLLSSSSVNDCQSSHTSLQEESNKKGAYDETSSLEYGTFRSAGRRLRVGLSYQRAFRSVTANDYGEYDKSASVFGCRGAYVDNTSSKLLLC